MPLYKVGSEMRTISPSEARGLQQSGQSVTRVRGTGSHSEERLMGGAQMGARVPQPGEAMRQRTRGGVPPSQVHRGPAAASPVKPEQMRPTGRTQAGNVSHAGNPAALGHGPWSPEANAERRATLRGHNTREEHYGHPGSTAHTPPVREAIERSHTPEVNRQRGETLRRRYGRESGV